MVKQYLIYPILFFSFISCQNTFRSVSLNVGDKLDSLDGVYVYYNGGMNNVSGRNLTNDGYNLGLKYQCVEFVKRYYYEKLKHKMPDSYGHAKDFFDARINDGALNKNRGLMQYTNGSLFKPEVNDILVFGPTTFNEFGHVGIVSKVFDDKIEMVQQNVGYNTREKYTLYLKQGRYYIESNSILGWLRKK